MDSSIFEICNYSLRYLHIPALERTKIPDETNHTPMIRIISIAKDGKVIVDSYAVENNEPIKEHAWSFTLSLHGIKNGN
jgi:3',5'-cyclic-AMP phosphodiesterase